MERFHSLELGREGVGGGMGMGMGMGVGSCIMIYGVVVEWMDL